MFISGSPLFQADSRVSKTPVCHVPVRTPLPSNGLSPSPTPPYESLPNPLLLMGPSLTHSSVWTPLPAPPYGLLSLNHSSVWTPLPHPLLRMDSPPSLAPRYGLPLPPPPVSPPFS